MLINAHCPFVNDKIDKRCTFSILLQYWSRNLNQNIPQNTQLFSHIQTPLQIQLSFSCHVAECIITKRWVQIQRLHMDIWCVQTLIKHVCVYVCEWKQPIQGQSSRSSSTCEDLSGQTPTFLMAQRISYAQMQVCLCSERFFSEPWPPPTRAWTKYTRITVYTSVSVITPSDSLARTKDSTFSASCSTWESALLCHIPSGP